jgi:simple sugar transport system ATP-binding protein
LAAPALELSGVRKVFGDCVAVDDVSLAVAPGEVVALVGENGAGKTTLMNVAYGLYRPTAGVVRVRGRALPAGSPADAIAAGVGMVHQHFMLVPPLSVAENVVLGAEPRRGLRFDRAGAERAVADIAGRLGFALDPRALVSACSVGTQQRVEIVKLLYRGAEVLILDEPTATLAPSEAQELLGLVRALAAEGKAVLLVSHKLAEVLAVATRVAVMRRGRLVSTVAAHDTSAAALAELMVGDASTEARVTPAPARGERVATLRGVSARGDRGELALDGIDLELHAGELVAIAGVDGNGQAELVQVLCGERPIEAGALDLAPGVRDRERLAWVPEDRQLQGLCLSMSVEENLVLGRHRRLSRRGFVDRDRRRALAERLVRDLDVRPGEPTRPAGELSGGNQQKVIVARELAAGEAPRLVVAVQPTRGLDLGATARVHERLRDARDRGAAVLVVSLDLDEVRALGDRVAVMAGGRIVAVLPAGADEREIGRHMLAGVRT